MGTERVLQELQWSGRDEWIKAQPGVWLVDRQPAGLCYILSTYPPIIIPPSYSLC